MNMDKNKIHSECKMASTPQRGLFNIDHRIFTGERNSESIDNLEKPVTGQVDSMLYEFRIFREVDKISQNIHVFLDINLNMCKMAFITRYNLNMCKSA